MIPHKASGGDALLGYAPLHGVLSPLKAEQRFFPYTGSYRIPQDLFTPCLLATPSLGTLLTPNLENKGIDNSGGEE
jgi:hypothetical protein